MGIGSSLSNALTTVKKKTDTYNKNRNYATDIDRTNKWSQQLEDTYNQINNMGKFSYDMNNDAFYQQYAQRYADNAKLAMQDTVGQISALTGGYGNSYAATAGQAMSKQQMEGLNDRATELYQLALQQYNAESDRLNNLYSITANAYGMEQDRINAEIAEAQWNADFDERQRQYNLGLMMDAAGMAIDVGKFGANMAFDVSRAAVSDYQWGKSFDYKAERDLVSDQQFKDQLALEYDALGREYDYKYAALEQDQNQHKAEMDYKYATLGGGSGGDDYSDVVYTKQGVQDYIKQTYGKNAVWIRSQQPDESDQMYQKYLETRLKEYIDKYENYYKDED